MSEVRGVRMSVYIMIIIITTMNMTCLNSRPLKQPLSLEWSFQVRIARFGFLVGSDC